VWRLIKNKQRIKTKQCAPRVGAHQRKKEERRESPLFYQVKKCYNINIKFAFLRVRSGALAQVLPLYKSKFDIELT
jgi:hypothetical protein